LPKTSATRRPKIDHVFARTRRECRRKHRIGKRCVQRIDYPCLSQKVSCATCPRNGRGIARIRERRHQNQSGETHRFERTRRGADIARVLGSNQNEIDAIAHLLKSPFVSAP
jgi:hypothetical protein